MKFRTEVRCYSCSRLCGEIEGLRPPVWVLFRADRVFPVSGCTAGSEADLRCGRCGGRVYPGETYRRAVDGAAQAAWPQAT